MLNIRWKRYLRREFVILAVSLLIGLGLAVAGRVIGGERNSGNIFIFAICFFSIILYFLIQSARALGWSILNLIKQ